MAHEQVRQIPPPDTVSYYDRYSEYYDAETREWGWPGTVEKLLARVFELKKPEEIHSVLDLGSGTGIAIAATKKYAAPSRVVAVDQSRCMLDKLRQKYPEHVEAVTDDIKGYTEASGERFDLITAMGVLDLVEDTPDRLAAISRLLKPTGALAITYVSRQEGQPRELFADDSDTLIKSTMMEYRWYPEEEIEEAVLASGLNIVARTEDVLAQTEDAETNTDERRYNFLVAIKPAE